MRTLLDDTAVVQVTATPTEIAQAEVQQEEKQRVFGVFPNFYVSFIWNAAPLNARQKFGLATHSVIDPVGFVAIGLVAGTQQAANTYGQYGQGAERYAKRFGADYADVFIGRMISSAILPSLLPQDPRYFYKGTGGVTRRAAYALRRVVITRGTMAVQSSIIRASSGFCRGRDFECLPSGERSRSRTDDQQRLHRLGGECSRQPAARVLLSQVDQECAGAGARREVGSGTGYEEVEAARVAGISESDS